MRPVSVAIDVPEPRAEAYDFLDVMANHESFTDHMLGDWTSSGPERGIGARARVTNLLGGRREPIDVEVVEAIDGELIGERNVASVSGRVGRGTYRLSDSPQGGTRISFTYEWEHAPLADRLLAPLVRVLMRRALNRALERLAAELDSGAAAAAG
jgi:hypothetical protein